MRIHIYVYIFMYYLLVDFFLKLQLCEFFICMYVGISTYFVSHSFVYMYSFYVDCTVLV